MMVKEKMSKLFTKKRRIDALSDFESRLELTLQKKKLKKKELEQKYYDFDFKPQTNKKRINIYSKKLPKKVVNTIKKKEKQSIMKKKRKSEEKALNETIRKKMNGKRGKVSRKKNEVKVEQVEVRKVEMREEIIGNENNGHKNQIIFDRDSDFETEERIIESPEFNVNEGPLVKMDEEDDVELKVVTVIRKDN